jgi:uncharacterized protein DUF1203
MAFQIHGLPAAPFQPLFALDDAALAAHHAVRRVADSSPGYPCRVSLRDAAPGEQLVLVHYEHHAVASPFRASHAIYIREHAEPAVLGVGAVPAMLRTRLLSLRAFDAAGMLLEADVVDGRELDPALERMVQRAAYVHIHFAKPGCYAARAVAA